MDAWFTDKQDILQFEELVRKSCGLEVVRFNDLKKGGYLDIQMLWSALGKPPSLVFGAGSSSTEHTDNECVEIMSLLKTRDFFVNVLNSSLE